MLTILIASVLSLVVLVRSTIPLAGGETTFDFVAPTDANNSFISRNAGEYDNLPKKGG